jgi:hypothetical protein
LDLESRVRDVLPRRAAFLAAPIATGAQELVRTLTVRLLESDQFITVWDTANERAHDQIVAMLTGRDNALVQRSGGQVILDLSPLIPEVVDRLEAQGLTLPKVVDVDGIKVRFVLVASDQLADAQRYTRMLDRLAWVLPILVIVLYAAAVVIARNRRRALRNVGIGIVVAMVAGVVGFGVARTVYLDNVPAGMDTAPAAEAIFDTITRYIGRGLRALLVIGAVIWFGTWLAGSSRPAVFVRRQWHQLLGKAETGLGDNLELGPVNEFVGRNVGALRIGVLAILAAVLVSWDHPTGLVIVMLSLVGLLAFAVIQLLSAGSRAQPTPT